MLQYVSTSLEVSSTDFRINSIRKIKLREDRSHVELASDVTQSHDHYLLLLFRRRRNTIASYLVSDHFSVTEEYVPLPHESVNI
ncbi:hypothetical protein AVEN_117710-1 [Araneus ventricosus]|uniref:Uncharacterized protein n=1 Tax=Araneus ventricosus TaxID=182803 RepID=A0A4Y2MK58_ARAVE|nr:hypothetical protein AVEN_117710-1 [Araneus ventricosus]